MKVVGIRRKSDGEILMAVPLGTPYRLPDGVSRADVEVVSILIHEDIYAEDPVDESMAKIRIDDMAEEQGIGVGDVVAKLTKAFGIKPCSSCDRRRQVLNKLRMVGWKVKWIDGEPEVDDANEK